MALAALRGDKAVADLADQVDFQPNRILQRKTQLLERAGVVFEGGGRTEAPQVNIKALRVDIGELTLEMIS